MMAQARRSPMLLPALLAAAGACCFFRVAFVPSAGVTRRPSISLRAEETEVKTETKDEYKLPKPDMRLMNDQSRVGASYDQDKRGNMWSVEAEKKYVENGEMIPAPIFFAILFFGSWALIVFFAQLTGTDSRFGGVIGDDQRAIADFS
eukprot:TRINITY_DN830_c0_g2_i1.p1 TRINITY_DN830_c0_g2~~TRINITY_DN830_c0_g2_i1.p1  ORF type:complete len:148 (-),score=26.25 TRINITY_DN830_c0_g2_i1:56-499(-)